MITYKPEADSIYVYLTLEPGAMVGRVVVLTDELVLDYDEAGSPIGVEILDVSHGFNLEGVPERARVEAELEKLARALDVPSSAVST